MTALQSAANRRGIALMTLSMASFIANDCLAKYVSESMPTPQLIFLRGLFSSLLLLAVAGATGALHKAPMHEGAGVWKVLTGPRVLVRSTLDAFATMAYLTALFQLPIANATAINMGTPLIITLLAGLVLRERVSRARGLAIAVGFAGVLLVVQPAANGFNRWALLCVVATVLGAVRDLLTRTIHANVPSALITLSTAAVTCVVSGAVVVALQEWSPVQPQQLGLLAINGVFLSIGYYLLIVSMRAGDLTVISPFRYTALLFALLVGWVVWGEVPNAVAWGGIVLLVGAGLYMLRSR